MSTSNMKTTAFFGWQETMSTVLCNLTVGRFHLQNFAQNVSVTEKPGSAVYLKELQTITNDKNNLTTRTSPTRWAAQKLSGERLKPPAAGQIITFSMGLNSAVVHAGIFSGKSLRENAVWRGKSLGWFSCLGRSKTVADIVHLGRH